MNDNSTTYWGPAIRNLEAQLVELATREPSEARELRILTIMVHIGVLKEVDKWCTTHPDVEVPSMLAGITGGIGQMLATLASAFRVDQSVVTPVDAVYWTTLDQLNPHLAQQQMAAHVFFEQEALRQINADKTPEEKH